MSLEASKSSLKSKIASRTGRASTMDTTLPKIGMEDRIVKARAEALKNFFQRKQLLSVPEEIKQAHPDKEFCFLNFRKLKESGMHHPNGWVPYKTPRDTEDQSHSKFNGEELDPYVHRGEMVMAWMPKKEFERKQAEEMLLRKNSDLASLITSSPELSRCVPVADVLQENVVINDSELALANKILDGE